MRILPLTLLIAAFAACSGGDDKSTDTEAGDETTDTEAGTDTESETETAFVRLAHLSPDAPAVDIYVNDPDTPALTGVEFGDNTDFIELPAGNLDVWISAAGTSSADAVLALEGLTLEANASYTAAAVGELADITAVLIPQDDDGLASGELRLNVAHAAPLAPEVDLWDLTSGTLLLENFVVADVATLDVPEGALSLGLDVDDDTIPDLTFDVPSLGADAVVDVFAVNDDTGAVFLWALPPSSEPASVAAEVYEAEDAALRVLHLSPDAPAVDVYLDDATEPSVEGAAFQDGTDYLTVPAGLHDVYVTASGSAKADAVLVVEDLFLGEGMDYSAVAYGKLASISALALDDSLDGLASGEIRFRVTHAAADVGEVDIWELSGPTLLLEDVAFGDSAVIDAAAGAMSVGIDVDDDAVPDLTFSVPSLGSDTLVNVYANNDEEGNVTLLAHLADGTVAVLSPDAD